MASPVAHSIAGFWTFLLLTARIKARLATVCRQYLPQLLLLILLANLPDVDFLFAFGTGEKANALHHGFTHSFAAAAFVALVVSCMWPIAGSFWRSAVLCFLAYSSHLLIDMCTGTNLGWNSTASAIPLFWPWETEFRLPLVLIVGVKHKDFAAIFSMKNVQSSLYELLIFGSTTVALVALWVRHQKTRATFFNRETAPRAGSNSDPVW